MELKTPFERIIDTGSGIPSAYNLRELFELAANVIIPLNEFDKDLLIIDLQNDFAEGGVLFHPTWWVNCSVIHPELFVTIITHRDMMDDKLMAANRDDYEAALERSEGKEKLFIWPTHAIPNTLG